MSLSKTCSVKRPQFGFMLQRPVTTGPVHLNGATQVEVQVQQVTNDCHELRVYDREEYLFYCIYCGLIDTNIAWVNCLA